MFEWMIMPLKRYADFKGRSRRKEFWFYNLMNIVVIAVLMGIKLNSGGIQEMADVAAGGNPLAVYGVMFSGTGILLAIWLLATFVPSIAVSVRRLHDRDLSGWWYLGVFVTSLIPLIGFVTSIAFLVVMFLEGTRGPNRFGPDPKNPSGADIFS